QLDNDGILCTVGIVVFLQLHAQAPCLNSHCGIQMWIEISRTAKNFSRYLIFLDGISRMIESLLTQISKQLTEGFRAVQNMTIHKSLYFLEALLPTGEMDSCHGHVTLQVTH